MDPERDPNAAPEEGTPAAPDPQQTAEGAPETPPPATPETEPAEGGDWETRYQNAVTAMGRQSNELGDLRKRVSEYEQRLVDLQARTQQPPAAPEPPPDPQKVREEAIRAEATDRYRVEYSVALTQAQAAGLEGDEAQKHAEQVASQRAWAEAERTYERETRLRQQFEKQQQATLEAIQRQMAPILAEQEVRKVIDPRAPRGVTRADLDEVLQQGGLSVEQLLTAPPEQRAFATLILDWAAAKAAEAKPSLTPRPPAPPPKLPANAAPTAGPRTEVAPRPLEDPKLDELRARARQAFPQLAQNQEAFERGVRAPRE